VAWLAPGYRAAVQDRSDERVRRENVRPGDEDVDFALAPDA
jgi:hypothetical protein